MITDAEKVLKALMAAIEKKVVERGEAYDRAYEAVALSEEFVREMKIIDDLTAEIWFLQEIVEAGRVS